MDFVKKVKERVLEEYSKRSGPYGMEMYDKHVAYVVRNSKELAKKLGANEEIVEISAFLHDIGRLDGDEKDIHHIVGSEYAEKFLREIGYPEEKIQYVKHCILAHRGSKDIKRETVEAECIASGDAMSHFENPLDMMSFVFTDLRKDTEEGRKMLKEKFERSFRKMIPEAQEMVKEKYEAIMKVLE